MYESPVDVVADKLREMALKSELGRMLRLLKGEHPDEVYADLFVDDLEPIIEQELEDAYYA